MSETFLSASDLVHDRAFVRNLILSMAAVATIGAVASFSIARSKLTVRPIASAEFVAHPNSSTVQPIARLPELSRPGDDQTVWSGYLAELRAVCAAGEPKPGPSVVLVKDARDDLRVGVANLSARSCAQAQNLKGNETVFIASDTPLPQGEKVRKYVTVTMSAVATR